ncbi:protein-S-isoprenylcysteine O-methyltransferase, putative [Perkinsus marinus ATCC 50983]|uniref:Protein-S-isoprenylcysteine O-methyltransferase n=1 Tax=Perkinsus marinus (strain ATCC 50983 / TXsc) TaxID=423536 RepID=C5KDT2_PERM5|nr:protein-S-isoprenylcysteine O-methyltransferase, putative [Perkinsus marinus ATCC 50983]EER17385.1 protein-S-isoprenylcysteine O-methyltransferase, putative [Perkinsus marinus ATCC 50983]|eukprot:XP_002785589.1 protein-S-isoprenylcysteine O-methyltransferase, putative [Perkinsus marinus ATCC 50983]
MPKLKKGNQDYSLLPVLLAFWLAAPIGAVITFYLLQRDLQALYSVELIEFLAAAVFGLVGINPDSKGPIILGCISATLGTFLGVATAFTAMGVCIPMQAFICALAVFHYGEFVCNYCFQDHESITYSTFLINNSGAFTIALSAAALEYTIMGGDGLGLLGKIGLIITIGGQLLRWAAFMSAGSNFTHRIRLQRGDAQQLITTGAYELCRHPGYSGWFWWAVGTQLLLGNRLCLLLYTICAWWFFYERLRFEERTLEYFYKGEYVRTFSRQTLKRPVRDIGTRSDAGFLLWT